MAPGLRLLALLVHTALSAHALVAQGPPVAASLVLRELATISLPRGLVVSGGMILDSTTVVVWGGNEPGALRCRPGSCEGIPGLVDSPLAGYASEDNASSPVEFLLSAPLRIRRPEGEDLCASHFEVGIHEVHAATRLASGWLIAEHDASTAIGTSTRLRFLRDGCADAEGTQYLIDVAYVHLTSFAGGTRASVQELVFPFRGWILAPAEGEDDEWELTEAAPLNPLIEAERFSVGHVALPRVPVRGGTLLTISDLHSDARTLLLLDGDGHVRRRRDVQAPIGFIDGKEPAGLVLAVRNRNGDEIVVYGYDL